MVYLSKFDLTRTYQYSEGSANISVPTFGEHSENSEIFSHQILTGKTDKSEPARQIMNH